jgi:Family of unknown function (DUF6527)
MNKKIYTTDFGYIFYCPGCKCGHGVWTNFPNEITGAKWSMSGDANNISFSPSIRVGSKCHLFIKNNKIEYLSDCEHEFAGKIIELEEF